MKPLLQFFAAGHYECDVEDCACPFASFTYEIGSYPDGSEVVLLIFECQWGHTTRLSLNQRKGEVLYHVEVETDPEMVEAKS